MAETDRKLVALADTLRDAIKATRLSYIDLGKLADVNPAQISRFMTGRDLTLQVASRLCLVLGYGLMKQAELRQEPLPKGELPTTRRRPEGEQKPASAHHRGRGTRVDLRPEADGEGAESAAEVATSTGDGDARPKRRRRAAAAASPAIEPKVAAAAPAEGEAAKPAGRRRAKKRQA